MTYKRIIKIYLPILQDLQLKASERDGVSMTVSCDGWSLVVTLSRPTNNPQCPRDIMHEHFNIGYSEEEMNQKVISLEAFFAEACMTTVTGIDYPIINN